MSRICLILTATMFALGCNRPDAAKVIVAPYSRITESTEPESATTTPETEPQLGELVRYEGDWIVNARRNDQRVVMKNEACDITVYTQKSTGCWGARLQRSMKMTFHPATNTYSAKIKWSNGDDINSHIRTPWLDHDLRGEWDDDSQTFTWIGKSDTNELLRELTIETVFHNENRQEHSITPTPLDTSNEFLKHYAQETMSRIW